MGEQTAAGNQPRHTPNYSDGTTPLLCDIPECLQLAPAGWLCDLHDPAQPPPPWVKRSTCSHRPTGKTYLRINTNGSRSAVTPCINCGSLSITVKLAGHDNAPLIQDLTCTDPCEVCGATTGIERHHWAPSALFPDADDWPTGALCRACHLRWHQTVTPHWHGAVT